MVDHDYGMNNAEKTCIDFLIAGQHYSHTGVYDIFSYELEGDGEQTFPIQIQGQENLEEPCYQMTDDMEMVFIFHPANSKPNSNFTYASSDFVWKYELQMKTDDQNKEIMKWIRFICFETCSPQQRAWFIPIKGLAFGE